MHVRHFYSWGYFHPITCGADVVAVNQLDYFRGRGWTVDCILVNDPRKVRFAEAFREKYSWLRSVTLVELPPAQFTLREQLFAYEQACKAPALARVLGEPTDLFLTNYVFSTPLLPQLPRSCKRILESVDILAPQFAVAEPPAAGGGKDPLAQARQAFLLRTELDLYRLYDAVLMINERELELTRARFITNATYVPQAYAPPRAGKRSRPDHEFDLIFVGSGVPINAQGITWFYRHVYVPYLWRHRVRMAIVGGVCRHLDLHDAFVTLLPEVEGSLANLYASTKVAIAPVFEGTGLSIKTLEGLAMGCAMVLTPAGARGFDDSANAYIKLDMKDNPRQTAEVILGLLANPERRKRLEQASAAYIRRCFSRERYFSAMDRVIESVGLGRRTAVVRAA